MEVALNVIASYLRGVVSCPYSSKAKYFLNAALNTAEVIRGQYAQPSVNRVLRDGLNNAFSNAGLG